MDEQTKLSNIQLYMHKLTLIAKEINQLKDDIWILQHQLSDIDKSPEGYYRHTSEVAYRSEKICYKLRSYLFDTLFIPKEEYYEQVSNALGIQIYQSDSGIVEITLPCLIPKRRKKDMKFLTDPLVSELSKFVLNRQLINPFEKFRHCTICITHLYDKAKSKRMLVRDHDNIELKAIMDVINTFLLTDDSGVYCNTYHSSCIGEANMTRVSIMKSDLFPEWILRHKNTLEIISQNHINQT